jgi:hypothetical protein
LAVWQGVGEMCVRPNWKEPPTRESLTGKV